MSTEFKDGSRRVLKEIFRKGQTPTQEEFYLFIDGVLNLHDDPLHNRSEGGVRIISDAEDKGANQVLVEFQRSRDDQDQNWAIRYQGEGAPQKGIAWGFTPPGDLQGQRPEQLVMTEKGNVGVSNPDPKHTLDVAGSVGMKTRIGTFASGSREADGEWRTILDNDTAPKAQGYFAAEVMAYLVPPQTGKGLYAITHAICVGAHPHRNGAFWERLGFHNRKGIQLTQSYFERKRRSIDLRWSGTYQQPELQIRTRGRLQGCTILYQITNLMPKVPNIPHP